MNSKEYRASLNVKIKDMTPEQRKKYNRLRAKESREKKKGATAESKPAEKPAQKKKVFEIVKKLPADGASEKSKQLRIADQVLRDAKPPTRPPASTINKKQKKIPTAKPAPKAKAKAKPKAKGGNIPNSKLKCFMRNAGGKVYRTCVKPEGNKQPKTQVRGNPRPAGDRKLPYKVAYPNAEARKKAQAKRKAKK